MRIVVTPLPRALHVRAVNDMDRPVQLFFNDQHMWRLVLLDESGRVLTYHIDHPARRSFWSHVLEPGQWFEAMFTNLPSGTFQARVDLLAEWVEPVLLERVTL
ncbi:MAG: hypothetical protein IMW98_09380 [Firmicutes bacterium]|nr:hypothetical protein [Bacillota bacterium]